VTRLQGFERRPRSNPLTALMSREAHPVHPRAREIDRAACCEIALGVAGVRVEMARMA